ncbi:MAG: PilZ domain-containing protein [Planctomycetota bacterium]
MPEKKFTRAIRLPEAHVDKLLEKMAAGNRPIENSRRRQSRVAYRVADVAMAITHPGGTRGHYLVHCRNLSSGGMSFLHGGFLHIGAQCCIVLHTRGGDLKALMGTIRSCRLITGQVHEVGVEFVERIDLDGFIDPNAAQEDGSGADASRDVRQQTIELAGDVLVLQTQDSDNLMRALDASGLAASSADCLGSALDQLKLTPFDAVVFDADTSAQTIEALQQAAGDATLIGISADVTLDPPLLTARDRDDVITALASALGSPEERAGSSVLHSRFAKDAAAATTIQNGVKRFAEFAEQLADGAAPEPAACRGIADVAVQAGFPSIAFAARRVASTDAGDAEKLRMAVEYLVGLCRRATSDRQGSAKAA